MIESTTQDITDTTSVQSTQYCNHLYYPVTFLNLQLHVFADNLEHVIRKRERWEKHRQSQERKKRMASEAEEGGEAIGARNAPFRARRTWKRLLPRFFMMRPLEMQSTSLSFRLLLLKDLDEDLEITHHADNTLHSFCKWQKSVNFRDDDHPNHHDVALLLTRRNICNRMNQPCGTLGLAQVSGMCQPHRSCSINEDTGLSLAWTVTHELGHNFDMKHDNNYSCKSAPNDTYVMAAQLSWDKSPTTGQTAAEPPSQNSWSNRDWGFCLDDEPGHHDFKYPVLPAGTMYDADHQCRILYGQDAALCNGIEVLENICSTLWCRVNNKCSTKLQPAAEGTICGTNRWCFAGNCVEIGDRPHAINGEWGEWAEWTSCSRTCGAGVSHSERHCNHPPPSNGGKYCIGERKRYRICNTDECPDDGLSFRHAQCLEFNEIPYKGNKYDWIPVHTPDTPCQLHCKPKDMFFSVLMKDIATDGTSCVSGSRHMCISGRCRHVGCDWEIDSSATEDRCGVCYGDGSTCTTVKKQFNETKAQGQLCQATVIPKDARNIRVEEIADASNFLALRNEKGEYYLNGHWFIQWSGDYEIAGTVVRYHRQGNKGKLSGSRTSKGAPAHNVADAGAQSGCGVRVHCTQAKRHRFSSAGVPLGVHRLVALHSSCGGGYQLSEVICVEKEAGQVDEKYCDSSTKPDDKQRSCNEHICPARWWTGPWQHCSVTCGEDGTHKRTVICVRSLGQDEQIALEDSACQGMKRPMGVEPCRSKDPCPGSVPEWVVGNWSSCNGNPCAKQTRAVLCSDVTLGCSPFTRPASSQPCSNVTCGTWRTEEWSGCTRTCNGGVQYRKYLALQKFAISN
ncbi:hypothetical protein C0Q70_20360 [Pomacea canaliculata]|uniref:Peptidase M12B domain-containing protein n=1 Tax=Pomacea canaliculata TaxID=400727 RepID=A0A2T7NFA4_POMCA|nr:hypothetical protein C0Q70_20360 [Pomacea canaliculata]